MFLQLPDQRNHLYKRPGNIIAHLHQPQHRADGHFPPDNIPGAQADRRKIDHDAQETAARIHNSLNLHRFQLFFLFVTEQLAEVLRRFFIAGKTFDGDQGSQLLLKIASHLSFPILCLQRPLLQGRHEEIAENNRQRRKQHQSQGDFPINKKGIGKRE